MADFTTRDNLNFLCHIPDMSIKEICELPAETLQHLVDLVSCAPDGYSSDEIFDVFFPYNDLEQLDIPAMRYRWLPKHQSNWYFPNGATVTTDDKVLYIKCHLLPRFVAFLAQALLTGLYPAFQETKAAQIAEAAKLAELTPADRFIESVTLIFQEQSEGLQELREFSSECEERLSQLEINRLTGMYEITTNHTDQPLGDPFAEELEAAAGAADILPEPGQVGSARYYSDRLDEVYESIGY